MTKDEVHQKVREILLESFLPDVDPEELEDATPLISGGILDSIATIRLVTSLEEAFGVGFEAHEMGADSIDTPAQITDLVSEKLGG